MTRRLPTSPDVRGDAVQIRFEGAPVRAYTGESVAVALHASGHQVLSRSLKYHRPRAFFCLEGHCGGCLMRINGVPNLRACMEPCRDGLEITGQNAYPVPGFDVLEAVDWFFPHGMDHHRLMTGSALLNSVASKIVRQLSGLGTLPDQAAADIPPATRLGVDVAVVGAGPAGLAAATAAARAGATTLLIDEHATPGGSLLGDPRHGPARAAELAGAARAAGVDVRTSATAIGFYPEDREPTLAVATAQGLMRVYARRTVYATGGYAVNRLFAGNDRPGVVAARAVGRLLVQHQVRPAERVCVVGGDAYALALAAALERAGCEVVLVPDHEQVVSALGHTRVSGVELVRDGQPVRIDCDLVAVSATPAPASEVPRQHGCAVELRPEAGGFAVRLDEHGVTSVPGVLACGDVCGYLGPEAALAHGERAGRVAARSLEETP